MNNKIALLSKINWIVVIIIMFSIRRVSAQFIINPYPCISQTELPSACNNGSYSITLQFHGASASGWSVFTGPGFPALGLGFNTPATPSRLSGLLNTGLTGSQPLRIQATVDGTTRTQDFTLFIDPACAVSVTASPCTWDIAFVLDRSGSMNWDGPPSRWDRVLEMFSNTPGVNYIQTMASAADLSGDDRWGLFFFGNDQVLHNPASHIGTFSSALSTASWPLPTGNTPMGAGLQSSLMNFFADATTPIGPGVPRGLGKGRAILLLTDGAQNQNPRVRVSLVGGGYNFGILEDLAWRNSAAILGAGSDLGLLPIPQERFALNDIRLFSVGIGSGIDAAAGSDIDHMSEEFVNSLNAANLTTFFNTTIPDIFRGHSPRILNIFRDTTPVLDKYNSQSFVVNGGVKNLTIQFVATDKTPFTSAIIVLQKDGVTLPVMPKLSNGRGILFDLDFPYKRGDSILIPDATGTWRILYGDLFPVPCMITVFADDKKVQPTLDFEGAKDFFTGDDLPVRLTLKSNDAHVTGATVVARLVRPQEDLGDFVSGISVPKDSLVQVINQDTMSLGQNKINLISATPAYQALLQRETSNEILLAHTGNGVYTGVFKGSLNNVIGGYRVIARAEGALPSGEPFESWELEGAFFDFARSEDITLHEQLLGTGKGDHPYILQITPTNRFGRKLGPAQERRIFVSLSQGTAGPVTDNLDGTYSIPLQAPAGANPTLRVSVINPNAPVLEKCLRCFNRNFGLSAHAGITFPFSKLDSLYNSGFYGEVDLAYRLYRNYSLELVGSYHGFSSGFSIASASLYGVYADPNALNPGWGARIAVGAGIFKPKNMDTTWGYGIRAAITRTLSSNWEADLNLSFSSLPDPKYAFGALGIGLHYWF